jgi:hypothetical protein
MTWYRTLNGRKVLWASMTLQVTPIFERYRVLIAYTLGVQPKVYVVDPEPVEEAHGIRTPHLNYDGSLCLYDPAKKQWTDADAIAHTTIPWTLRWLFHYENWLCSGLWMGDSPSLVDAAELVSTGGSPESHE